MLENRLFSREELVRMLVSASLPGDGLDPKVDLEAAVLREMTFMFQQGINCRTPVLDNAYLTLKALFLYACSLEGGVENPTKFWGDVIDVAVRGNAGVKVTRAFEDQGGVKKAYEWFMDKYRCVDKTLPMATRVFISPPMFVNGQSVGAGGEGPGDGMVESVGGDGSEDGVAAEVDDAGGVGGDGPGNGVAPDVGDAEGPGYAGARDDSGSGDTKSLAASIVNGLKYLRTKSDVISVLGDFYRGRRNPRRTPTRADDLPGFEYDADIVWRAAEVIGHRQAHAKNDKEVEDLQVPQNPDESG